MSDEQPVVTRLQLAATANALGQGDTVFEINPAQFIDGQGQLIWRYFKSNWFTAYKPFVQCPFYLEGYDASKKAFTIQVLWDGRKLAIPVGSPVIPITEAKAEELKQVHLSKNQQNQQTTMSETTTETPPLSERPENGAAPADAKPAKEKKPKAPRVRDDGKKPIRQIVLEGLAAGKERKAIVDDILVVYPEKDRTKAGQLASLYKYNKKTADEKAAKAATEPAPAAAPTEAPTPAEPTPAA